MERISPDVFRDKTVRRVRPPNHGIGRLEIEFTDDSQLRVHEQDGRLQVTYCAPVARVENR